MPTQNRRAEGLGEFADSIGVSYDTLWRAVNDGRLKVIRCGKRLLIPQSEIERVLTEGLGKRPAANKNEPVSRNSCDPGRGDKSGTD